MKQLLAVLLASTLAACGQALLSAPVPPVLAEAPGVAQTLGGHHWLGQGTSGPGWATVLIKRHPWPCPTPTRNAALDEVPISPIYPNAGDPTSFIVQAKSGKHLVRVADVCPNGTVEDSLVLLIPGKS